MTEDTLLAIFTALAFLLGVLGGYLAARRPGSPEPAPSPGGKPSTCTPQLSAFTRAFYGR